MILSIKIMLYNFFLRIFVPYCQDPINVTRFGISPDQAASLQDESKTFFFNFDLYVDPNSYSTPVVNDTNTSYLACFQVSESIKNQIKSNTTIKLSGVERWILDIPVPVPHRSHVKVPDIEPAVVCVLKASLLMKFIAFNPTNPFKKGKPTDVSSIGIKIAYTDAGAPPPNLKDYITQIPEKNIEFEMLFTSDQVGKTLYIICYYLNNRNEAGKDGLPYSVTII